MNKNKTIIKMNFYMIVNSDQCQRFFPSNKAYHFRTHIKAHRSLQGTWKVALTEIYITESSPLPYKNYTFIPIFVGIL